MNQTIYLGFIASLLAGMGTALGALPIFFTTKLEKKWQGILLGLGGGVMLAATTFSLIIPGTEAAMSLGYSKQQAALIVSAGIILGAGFLWLLHNNFPSLGARSRINRTMPLRLSSARGRTATNIFSKVKKVKLLRISKESGYLF